MCEYIKTEIQRGMNTMNMEQIKKIVKEYSILSEGSPFKSIDNCANIAIVATDLSEDGMFRADFMQHLINSDAHNFEFRKLSDLPHLIDGTITIDAWIYPLDGKYCLTVCEYTEGNKRHWFTTEEELIKILIDLGLDRKN